jgi:hypothetical protein
MVSTSLPLQRELEIRVHARTGRRVRNLAVEVIPEGVVLKGHTASYYVKQLAQEEVCDVLPHVRLHNAIVVQRANR